MSEEETKHAVDEILRSEKRIKTSAKIIFGLVFFWIIISIFFWTTAARAETIAENENEIDTYYRAVISPLLDLDVTAQNYYIRFFTNLSSGTEDCKVSFYDLGVLKYQTDWLDCAPDENIFLLANSYAGHINAIRVDDNGATSPYDYIGQDSDGKLVFELANSYGFTGSPENPLASVIWPEEGETIEQDIINGVGGDAFYFEVLTDVNGLEEYTGEYVNYELEIYDDLDFLYCKMTAGPSGSLLDGTFYGAYLNHFVNGEDCANFIVGSYTAQTRAQLVGYDWGEWSDELSFDVGTYTDPYYLECPDEPSWFSTCWFQKILAFLFVPSESSINGLFARIEDFNDSFPFSWITGATEAISGGFDVETEDLGEANAANIFLGEVPNGAWWTESLRQFYGDWAGAATAAFIWFGVLIAIMRSAYAAFGIEDNLPFDTGI